MNRKLNKALKRLQDILPFEDRMKNCTKQTGMLHQRILSSFVYQGRILTRKEMAQHTNNLEDTINKLSNSGMVIFSKNGEPVGAYPFTMEKREYMVKVNGHQVYAMCALDALAISPMFKMKTEIVSLCRVTGDLVRIKQSGKTIENMDDMETIHFGIDWIAVDSESCCVDSLCKEMLFLRDNSISQQWLRDNPRDREIFTLFEAIEFAYLFFTPFISLEM